MRPAAQVGHENYRATLGFASLARLTSGKKRSQQRWHTAAMAACSSVAAAACTWRRRRWRKGRRRQVYGEAADGAAGERRERAALGASGDD